MTAKQNSAGDVRFPLDGVVVLDVADEPVALAARLLGDLGAEVIRVEAREGDWLRTNPPFVHDAPGLEVALSHILYNAGKRSLALDLSELRAWNVVERVAAGADVVIGPLRPSSLCQAFLNELSFSQRAPTVGVVEPVFRRGIAAEATDLIGVAAGGQLQLNGYLEDPPNHPAGNLAYKQLSLAAALAGLSMVLERAAGRQPGRIQVSMQEAVMWTTIQSANENYWHWHQMSPTRRGIENVGGQTIFSARDGKYLSLYHHPPAFAAFARWYRELFGDDRFTLPPWDDGFYRFEHASEVTEITARLCSSMDRDELVQEGQKRGILAVPVQGVSEIAHDPHLRDRGFFQQIRLGHSDSPIEVMRAPFISSEYRAVAKRPPVLGEHTRDVLRDKAGLSDADIDALIEDGVAFEPGEGAVA